MEDTELPSSLDSKLKAFCWWDGEPPAPSFTHWTAHGTVVIRVKIPGVATEVLWRPKDSEELRLLGSDDMTRTGRLETFTWETMTVKQVLQFQVWCRKICQTGTISTSSRPPSSPWRSLSQARCRYRHVQRGAEGRHGETRQIALIGIGADVALARLPQ